MFWCSIWNASNTFWWEVGGNNRSKYCESVQMFLSFQFCANLIFLREYFPVISHFRKTVSLKTRYRQTPNHFEMERSRWKVWKLAKCIVKCDDIVRSSVRNPHWHIFEKKSGKVGCWWCYGGGGWYKKGKENKILFYFRTQFEHNFITKSFQQIRLAMVDSGQVKINLDLPSL